MPSQEVIVAAVGAAGVVGGAVVAAVPSMLGLRRAQGAAEAEGTATRDSVEVLGARLSAEIGAVKDELRSDVAELRHEVAEVRDWQAAHSTAHTLVSLERHRERLRSSNQRGNTPPAS